MVKRSRRRYCHRPKEQEKNESMEGFVSFFGPCDSLESSCSKECKLLNDNLFLPPEAMDGNVEYKLKLIDPYPSRFEHLVTQLKWRLEEGLGQAIYEVGVEDNGVLSGLTQNEMDASLNTLRRMAARLSASFSILNLRKLNTHDGCERQIAEVLIRSNQDYSQRLTEMRIAVLGAADSGKSSLIGVLSSGELDNGHGRSRLNLFRHLHEIESGRTSSITKEVLGFDDSGETLSYKTCKTPEEMVNKSSRLVTFIDLAGHQKYMRTTLFGLTSHSPHFVLLTVSATQGIVPTTKAFLDFTSALKLPVFIVISKRDLCSEERIHNIYDYLKRILGTSEVNRNPVLISSSVNICDVAEAFDEGKICPIFSVSCVKGSGLDLLIQFLNALTISMDCCYPINNAGDDDIEFLIDQVFHVGNRILVVAGLLLSGTITSKTELLLGPLQDGSFKTVHVDSIRRKNVPCSAIYAGQSASLALQNVDPKALRKGMVLVSSKSAPSKVCFEFDADIIVNSVSHAISKGFQVTVHVDNVCQTATIIKTDKPLIRPKERARVTFRFQRRPEFIRIGSKLIFREGNTNGMGEVISINPEKPAS